MASRTRHPALLAVGVGALVGAAQLGVGYGLDVVRIARDFTVGTVNHWPAQLTWLTWIAALAAVAGAVAADRAGRRYGRRPTTGQRALTAVTAGLGAAVVAPLGMLPARMASVGSVDPVLAAGLCAGLGALAGTCAALAVLMRPPVGWNIAALAAGVWLLALASIAPSLGTSGPLPAVRLGALDAAWLDPDLAQRLALVTMPALALVAGAATGWVARQRSHPVSTTAICGAAGPVLLALSYLAAGPGTAIDGFQAVPYWGALISAATGTIGSVLAAVLPRPDLDRQLGSGPSSGLPADRHGIAGEPTDHGERQDRAESPGQDAQRVVLEPTDILPAIPKPRSPGSVSDPPSVDSLGSASVGGEPAGPVTTTAENADTSITGRADAVTAVAKPKRRRARSRKTERTQAVPADEEEYVGWVSGLADPLTQPDEPSVRRRLARGAVRHGDVDTDAGAGSER